MNYKPAISWGVYGGSSIFEISSYFSSWGLLGDAHIPPLITYRRGKANFGFSLSNFWRF